MKALFSVAPTVAAVFFSSIFSLSYSSAVSAEAFGDGVKTRPVKCLLQVKGKTYLTGTCKYDGDADGSFRLYGKQYFVYLNTFEKNKAEASWNASPQSNHAQAPLGELKREGACWVSKTTKICAWDQPPKPVADGSIRVKFAPNATSAVVTGKLSNYKGQQTYLLEVRKGQTLQVEQLNPGNKRVTLGITAPNGEDASDMDLSCNNKKTVKPTLAGDYVISVHECMKADEWKGNFKLKITVK